MAHTSLFLAKLIINNDSLREQLYVIKFYVDIADEYFYFWCDLPFITNYGVEYLIEGNLISIAPLGEEGSFNFYADATAPVCCECYNAFLANNKLPGAHTSSGS